MVLCPPRKMLEINLNNHLVRFKHQKAVEDANQQSREPARTGRPRCPSKSTAISSHSNQVDLHSWLRHTSSTISEGTHANVHKDLFASLLYMFLDYVACLQINYSSCLQFL